ncbi:MAG: hypothetical protein IKE52_03050 [Mogibacterium sp.]|nr:hypothetical protein [Mogibacterium sp.]
MTGVPLNIDWQQILLHLFNFTILFGALYILLYKPVKDFMAGREAHYAEIDSRAKQALADAESDKETYAAKVRAFDEEAREEKAKMRADIEAERGRRLSDAKSEADKIIKDANEIAEKKKGDIVSAAQKEIREMITDAMDKLSEGQTESEVFDKFLDAAEGKNK